MSDVNDSWDRTRIIGKQMTDRLNSCMANEHTRRVVEALVTRATPLVSMLAENLSKTDELVLTAKPLDERHGRASFINRMLESTSPNIGVILVAHGLKT